YSASYHILEGGLAIGNPSKDIIRHGQRISSIKRNNRLITLRCRITAESNSELRDRVDAIERLLHNAETRYQSGYGDSVYLEYQWGSTTGQNVYFDVIHGELQLPPDVQSVTLKQNYIVNARIVLECEPFARYADKDLPRASVMNSGGGGYHNYIDIPALAINSDVPAPAYINITPQLATGTKTLYIAKRSGARYNDNLWIEDNKTPIWGTLATHEQSYYDFIFAHDEECSDERYFRITHAPHPDDIAATGGIVSVAKYLFSSQDFKLPTGVFRLLARCRVNSPTPVNAGFGYGYYYGYEGAGHGIEKMPSIIKGDFKQPDRPNVWQLLDLGVLVLPPHNLSKYAKNAQMYLNIYHAFLDNYTGTIPVDHSLESSSRDWVNPEYAYDGNPDTTADYHGDYDPYLVPQITFTRPAHSCNGVYVNYTVVADYEGYRSWDLRKVEVYYGGAWVTIASASSDLGRGYYPIGSTQTVEGVRLTFRHYGAGTDILRLREVTFVDLIDFDLDYLFLLPVDEGYVIAKSPAGDVETIVTLDGISRHTGVYLTQFDEILGVTEWMGSPPTLGQETTRIYVLRDDSPNMGHSVNIKYRPLRRTI
ncbi:MAG: hypothetical protein M0P37_07090, partial [Synergistaceae bacterium]|nr:hypothetical protein [Synergistaceae bacterium]